MVCSELPKRPLMDAIAGGRCQPGTCVVLTWRWSQRMLLALTYTMMVFSAGGLQKSTLFVTGRGSLLGPRTSGAPKCWGPKTKPESSALAVCCPSRSPNRGPPISNNLHCFRTSTLQRCVRGTPTTCWLVSMMRYVCAPRARPVDAAAMPADCHIGRKGRNIHFVSPINHAS